MKARGACPGIATPMRTGDGLLARLIPCAPLKIEPLQLLCDAAERHGNGIIEVTQRGNLQIRGLSESSAPDFAAIAGTLDVASDTGPPLLTSPLLGLDPDEPFDATPIVADLRSALTTCTELIGLGPKVSVLVDGGGRLHANAVSADVRLNAIPGGRFAVSIGGNRQGAVYLGTVHREQAIDTVLDLLREIARRGPAARARDLDVAAGKSADAAGPAELGGPADTSALPDSEPVGIHPLKNGRAACGFAFPFGHTTAHLLRQLLLAAASHGALSIRPAPGRACLAIGLEPGQVSQLTGRIGELGFVTDPRDPRRHVVACPGSPACSSAEWATRQIAPQLARAARPLVGTTRLIHLSGCEKGCAHSGPAAITIVGAGRLVLNGRAADPPSLTLPADTLIADIERLSTELANV